MRHAMPEKIHPMLAYRVEKTFDSDQWLFETKWDGFRAIAEVNDREVKLYSRNYHSFNPRFGPIVKALQELHVKAIFDGEIVVVDKTGKSDFQKLQNYQKTGVGDLRYMIFDLLFFDGNDLRNLPLIKRKELLHALLKSPKAAILQISPYVMALGNKLFATAQKKGLEGIMAKEINSPYRSTRSRDWLKIKTKNRQEAIICGFTEPKGSREKFGSLVLGIYDQGKLTYVGRVGTGFTRKILDDVMHQLRPLIVKRCPFATPPSAAAGVTWIKPKLLCEVAFAEWTAEGLMRQPVFLGIRTDKKPTEAKKENVIETI